MSFSIGIIGLPNVGKSTLFKALTKKPVNISNYPFCTIDPNVGIVEVPDERLTKLAEVLKPTKTIPTVIEFVDIAGLVKNAHQGEGLGNQFLSHIREVKAIVQVLRDFTDPNVAHVAGQVNPKSDQETVNLELIFADLETLKKFKTKQIKLAHSQDKTAIKILAIIEELQSVLETGKSANTVELTDDEKYLIKEMNLLTLKPMIYVLNVDEDKINQEQAGFITISAKIESELAELDDNEQAEYLKELGLSQSGREKLIKKSYQILNLITFFTTQSNILQAWTVKQGSTAPQAASVIHSDFQNKFIKADVINWQDLVEIGSEHLAYDKGKIRTEGKNYIVQDGDVIHFKHG